jgi:predicted DNA-binding transcriptional regulator AlpA
MTTPGNRYVNDIEAARLLGVAQTTLIKWRQIGKGPPFLRLGRRVVYSLGVLEAWAAAQMVHPRARKEDRA